MRCHYRSKGSTILTISNFFIRLEKVMVCVYACMWVKGFSKSTRSTWKVMVNVSLFCRLIPIASVGLMSYTHTSFKWESSLVCVCRTFFGVCQRRQSTLKLRQAKEREKNEGEEGLHLRHINHGCVLRRERSLHNCWRQTLDTSQQTNKPSTTTTPTRWLRHVPIREWILYNYFSNVSFALHSLIDL